MATSRVPAKPAEPAWHQIFRVIRGMVFDKARRPGAPYADLRNHLWHLFST